MTHDMRLYSTTKRSIKTHEPYDHGECSVSVDRGKRREKVLDGSGFDGCLLDQLITKFSNQLQAIGRDVVWN